MQATGERLLLGTRKGLIVLQREASRWRPRQLAHAGIPVCFAARDPRTGTLWASLEHGHWGPKLSRSRDDGGSWADVPLLRYPGGATYAAGQGGEREPATLSLIWALAFGTGAQPGRIYAGTEPGGLFVSDDDGESFVLNEGLWNHPSRQGEDTGWFAGGRNEGRGGPGIHSILVDPRDPRHLFVAVSCAGVFETVDGGISWQGRNRGMTVSFLPDPEPEYGHDPHCVVACPAQPNYLWQQNHCGIFRSTDGGQRWQAVSQEGQTAHFGFPIAVDENDGDIAWVMPAASDERRMTVAGALVVCRTEDGGAAWQELRTGLPQENAYDLVLRHALDISGQRLAFASTTGNVYLSEDRGDHWACLGSNFPPVYSVRFG